MGLYTIYIKDIAKSHNETLEICNLLVNQYTNFPDAELIIDFSDCNFIYPDYALLFLCTIKYIEHMGHKVTGKIKLDANKNIVNYLAKMSFFEHLNVTLPLNSLFSFLVQKVLLPLIF